MKTFWAILLVLSAQSANAGIDCSPWLDEDNDGSIPLVLSADPDTDGNYSGPSGDKWKLRVGSFIAKKDVEQSGAIITVEKGSYVITVSEPVTLGPAYKIVIAPKSYPERDDHLKGIKYSLPGNGHTAGPIQVLACEID